MEYLYSADRGALLMMSGRPDPDLTRCDFRALQLVLPANHSCFRGAGSSLLPLLARAVAGFDIAVTNWVPPYPIRSLAYIVHACIHTYNTYTFSSASCRLVVCMSP